MIDSVQTLHSAELTGAPGSVGQVREVAARLERFARERGCAVILVGHVTKEGALAGPRVLEHAVDCVLQFEGERSAPTARCARSRTASAPPTRSACSRCAPAAWPRSPTPPSASCGEAEPVPGSCVLCAMEGTRPLLVEVQALVAPTDVVPPRRVANGIDRNRLSLVLAVLGAPRRPVAGRRADVFVSVAGGVRIEEPGADLAVALAVASRGPGRRRWAAASARSPASAKSG